jgi:hypothetical protein
LAVQTFLGSDVASGPSEDLEKDTSVPAEKKRKQRSSIRRDSHEDSAANGSAAIGTGIAQGDYNFDIFTEDDEEMVPRHRHRGGEEDNGADDVELPPPRKLTKHAPMTIDLTQDPDPASSYSSMTVPCISLAIVR